MGWGRRLREERINRRGPLPRVQVPQQHLERPCPHLLHCRLALNPRPPHPCPSRKLNRSSIHGKQHCHGRRCRSHRQAHAPTDGALYYLLKRHSSIVRRPGHMCKHVRSPNSLPAISDEVKGSHAIAHATTWGKTYSTISLSKV